MEDYDDADGNFTCAASGGVSTVDYNISNTENVHILASKTERNQTIFQSSVSSHLTQ